jgi:hypothetical protein
MVETTTRVTAATAAMRRAPWSSDPSTDRMRWTTTSGLARRRARWPGPWARSTDIRPAFSSSAGVLSTVTRSPTCTVWSRPGQATVCEPSAETTAIGARAPNRARSVANRTTSTSAVTKRDPSNSIWYEFPAQAGLHDRRGGQCGLEDLDLGRLGADHRPGSAEPRPVQDPPDPSAAHDERDAP